jgi:hypothetical protein
LTVDGRKMTRRARVAWRRENVVRKDRIRNCIYQFKQLNELIEEQKSIQENDNQNSMFDIVIRHEYTPTGTSQGTRV